MPEVKLRRYHTNDNSTITWTWKYPDTVNELDGFRLYRDGKVIADEKKLTKAVRKWTVGDFEEGTPTKFQIQAVSKYNQTKLSKAKTYTLKTEKE